MKENQNSVFVSTANTHLIYALFSTSTHTCKDNENILKIVGMGKKKKCNVKNAVSGSSRVLNHFVGRSITLT